VNVSGKMLVNACSSVLVGSESVIAAWSRDWGGGGVVVRMWGGVVLLLVSGPVW
jgi:hypothetical protein